MTTDVVIATKVGGRPPRPTSGMSRDIEGLAPDTIRTAARRSLETLGRERIDPKLEEAARHLAAVQAKIDHHRGGRRTAGPVRTGRRASRSPSVTARLTVSS